LLLENKTHKFWQLKDITVLNAPVAEIAAALNGDYRSEHIFILQQELQLYDVYQAQIAACDYQIQECLAEFSDKVNLDESPLPQPKHPRNKPQGNEPDA
jgi:hypothetical protein